MDSKDKKKLSESDICDLFITPAIKDAGWNAFTQIRREVTLTPGPVVVRGTMSSRNKNKKKFADYVLSWEPGVPVAVVEAKDNNHTVSHGMQQALGYAEILEVPSAFSSNGDAFASHNKTPDAGEDIETELALKAFPTPDELWKRYKKFRGIEEANESLVLQPYHQDPSGKEPRYYQVDAINRVVEAVANNQKRILLVMATGTGIREAFEVAAAGAVVQNLNADKVRELVIPIPPINEQHRIVTKADEIMALCDTLKARLADAQTIQLHLADAIVEQAVA